MRMSADWRADIAKDYELVVMSLMLLVGRGERQDEMLHAGQACRRRFGEPCELEDDFC